MLGNTLLNTPICQHFPAAASFFFLQICKIIVIAVIAAADIMEMYGRVYALAASETHLYIKQKCDAMEPYFSHQSKHIPCSPN